MRSSFFAQNIGLKVASFFLAAALWFFVILSGRSGTVIDVPIMYMNLPPDLEVVDFPKAISVNIEGQERMLQNLRPHEVTAIVDLSNAKTGRSFLTLGRDNIRLPKTIEIMSIDPQTISLTIEQQLKKTVSVQPAIVGLPKQGFVVLGMEVAPDAVVIEGPRSIVSNIYNVKTEPIDITGLNRDLRYTAKINLTNPNLKAEIQRVAVDISVKKIK
ncbi:MAG: hypothetical protein C4560_05315 [Nitrospiraceae bacterium]|nr:MAG: hypothetical protein C4560_05315 [Nitrospiraceae bacterium]